MQMQIFRGRVVVLLMGFVGMYAGELKTAEIAKGAEIVLLVLGRGDLFISSNAIACCNSPKRNPKCLIIASLRFLIWLFLR